VVRTRASSSLPLSICSKRKAVTVWSLAAARSRPLHANGEDDRDDDRRN
jgi:hypothetical protein